MWLLKRGFPKYGVVPMDIGKSMLRRGTCIVLPEILVIANFSQC